MIDRELRAVLLDSRGPLVARSLVLALGGFVLFATLPLLLVAPIVATYTLFGGPAILAAARYVRLGRERRNVTVRLEERAIVLADAGLFGGWIDAFEILGAASTSLGPPYVLALQVRGRPAPIALEFPDYASLRAARRALGVGVMGSGSLEYAAAPSMVAQLEGATRLALSLALVVLLACIGNAPDLAMLDALLVFVLAPTALSLALSRLFIKPAPLRVDAHGVHAEIQNRKVDLAYPWLSQLAVTPRGFEARADTTSPSVPIDASTSWLAAEGTSPAMKNVVQALVADAAARARGQVPRSNAAAEELARRPGEHPAQWLARIDTLAATRSAGYRGVTLANDELLAAVEDADLPIEVRAGAARLLARMGDAVRVRIAPMVAAEPDPGARLRIDAACAGRDVELVAALSAEWVASRSA